MKGPLLCTYNDYCANYSSALKLLEVLQNSKPEFAEFLSEKHLSDVSLQDLLITPVQRNHTFIDVFIP